MGVLAVRRHARRIFGVNQLIVASVLAVTSLAHAESLEERKYWRAKMDRIEGKLKEAIESCGVELTFEYVGKEALRENAEKEKYAPNVLCQYVIEQVGSRCRDGDKPKAAVARKVKGMQCTYGAKRSVTFKNGIVLLKGNGHDFNGLAGFIYDELKKKF